MSALAINSITLTLAERIQVAVSSFKGVFSLQVLYNMFPEEKESTIRGRVYRELIGKGVVTKEGRGLYSFKGVNGEEGLILNGDARKLDVIESESIDLIIADHPYPIQKGSNRNSNSSYIDTTFEYTAEDFESKARVLKKGAFLVEFLPEMKETNIEYIMKVLTLAKKAGFNFYCKVPWFKAEIRDGRLIDGSAFVGRKAVMEEVYIFSKGTPRKLRVRKQGESKRIESGAKSMLPAVFMESPVAPSRKVHQAQKPLKLLQKIIDSLSRETEVVLDQFAGSFVTFWASISLNRRAIAIEINEDFIEKQLDSITGKKND